MMGGEGLGNQLFTYASGLLAKKVTGLPICIIPVKDNPHSKIDYRYLFDGTIVDQTALKKRISEAKSIVKNVKQDGVVGRWLNSNIQYNSNTNKGMNVKLPSLLYQNYKGIESVIPQVKESLIKNEFHKEKYGNLKEKHNIHPSTSAFMHIRRGDYVERNWSLNISYYAVALDHLNKNTTIEKIFIVSNDIDWFKSNSSKFGEHFNREIIYLDNLNELETLYCMMCCEAGAIISNSTFSSWGAMLGADMNSKSTITYPSPWINRAPKNYENPFMFPDRWIRINNENAHR
jgi:hypothetical protein